MSYLTLPPKAKPSRGVSKDATRPVLTRGELVENDGNWFLHVTNSYTAAILPLTLQEGGEGEPVAGPVSSLALKAIETTGHFRAGEYIEPLTKHGAPIGVLYSRTDPSPLGKQFPDVASLIPDVDPEAFAVGLNAGLLADLVTSLGKVGRDARISLTFGMVNGSPGPLRPIRVGVLGGDGIGLLMPIRLNV